MARALATWAIGAVVAGVAWLVIVRWFAPSKRRKAEDLSERSAYAWLVALLFGMQSMVYYGVLAWLAPLYEERGWSKSQAGLLLSLFTASQIVGSMSASVIVQRSARLVAGLRVTALVTAAGVLLVGLTPLSAPWLWATVLGLGAGGIFTLALTVPLAVTGTVDGARRMTATTLCYGYLLAATGPFVVSVLRSLSGDFRLSFSLLSVVSLLALAIAWTVTTRQLPSRREPTVCDSSP